MQQHYLVIEDIAIDGEDYALKMLEHNPTPPFLPVHLRSMNSQPRLLYEAAGRQPLPVCFERRQMSYEDIAGLLRCLDQAYVQTQRLLLDPAAVRLDPACIFKNRSSDGYEFIYLPVLSDSGSHDQGNELEELAEYILKQLDHSDPGTVKIGYAFYEQAEDGLFRLQEILDAADNSREPESSETEYQTLEKAPVYQPLYDDDRRNHGKNQMAQRVQRSPQPASSAMQETVSEVWDSWTDDDPVTGQQKRVRKKKKRPATKKFWLSAAGILPVTLLYGFLAWFFRMDLFQLIGLFTLFVAVIWLIYTTISSRWNTEEHLWDGLDLEEDDEDAFLEALLNDMDEEEGKAASFPPVSEQTKYRQHREGPPADIRQHGPTGSSGTAEPVSGGETRYLGAAPGFTGLTFVSRDVRRCRDLTMESRIAVIGKQENEVDLCIRNEAVSRTHAKVEQDENGFFLTDLNSTNGTIINGEQAVPFRRYPLQDGDRVGFAAIYFRVKIDPV